MRNNALLNSIESNSKNLALLFDCAWDLRWAQKIDEAQVLLREITGHAPTQSSLGENSFELERQLLVASIYRAHGQWKACKDIHLTIQNKALEWAIPLSPRCYFEFALVEMTEGKFLKALEYFLLAIDRSKRTEEKAIASVNAILCYEGLGLDPEQLLHRCHEWIACLDPSAHNLKEAIDSQIVAYQFRNLFREGKFDEITKLENRRIKKDPNLIDQARYFDLWVQKLPYSGKNLDSDALSVLVKGTPTFFAKNYRMITLFGAGQFFEDEKHNQIKISEKISRLYLWTWYWLCNVGDVKLSQLILLMKAIFSDQNLPFVTVDGALLFRNALLWMSVFDTEIISLLEKCETILPLPKKDSYAPWLIHEFKVVTCGIPSIKNFVKQHLPLQAQESILKKIELKKDKIKNQENAQLFIDFENWTLYDRKNNTQIISESLSRAISLLKFKNNINLTEFFLEVFGIKYEPELHQTKAFNLLARIRKLLGNKFEVGIKEGQVHSKGNWNHVAIKKLNKIGTEVRNTRRSLQLNMSIIDPERSLTSAHQLDLAWLEQLKNLNKPFNRKNVAQIVPGSRCTVIRKINQWIKEGRLIREGTAKKTVYSVIF